MATRYLDLQSGNDANDGSTIALAKKTLSNASTGLTGGDEVRVLKSADPTSIGNATWTNRSATVTLASARTKNAYLDGAWTASANVTATASATRKEGANASQLAIAAGFTTGLVGYYALGSTEDFSAYQKISFQLRTSAIVSDLSIFYVAFCSDTVGAVVVDTLTLPAIGSIANTYLPILIDKAAALGSSIQSIALYATVDPGAVNVLIDDIVATNDIHHGAPISKNTGSELWWPIRSINGTTVILDSGPASLASTTPKGYKGTTETVTTYMREPIKHATVAAATTDLETLSSSGSAGNPLVISGGWEDVAGTPTQTSVTWVTGQNNTGELIGIAARTNFRIEKINAFGVSKIVAVSGVSNNTHFKDCQSCLTAATSFIVNPTAGNHIHIFEDCAAVSCDAEGFSWNTVGGFYGKGSIRAHMCSPGLGISNTGSPILENADFDNNAIGIESTNVAFLDMRGTNTASFSTGAGVSLLNCNNWTVRGLTAKDCTTVGLTFSGSMDCVFYDLVTTGNTNASIDSNTESNGINYFYNWTHDEATTVLTPVDYENSQFVSVKDNGGANAHAIRTDGGLISSTTAVRHTASGIAWQLQPTSATRTENYPLVQRIAALPVKANIAVTAKTWLRRTNTGITGTFRIRGNQVTGVTSEVTGSISAAADTWEEITLSFTPTEDGVVEFEVLAYGGTTYTLYWDDFSTTMASKINTSSGDYAFARQGAYIGEDGNSGSGGGSYTFS